MNAPTAGKFLAEQVTAVILAGGAGTRIRHLLPDLPKPMAPVAGRPFLEWIVRYLAKQSVSTAIISTGYKSEVIESHFSQTRVDGIATRCVPEPEPMGTAGGFLHAARQSGQQPAAWLVLNGDSLIFAGLKGLAAVLLESEAAGVLLGCPVPDASRFGSLVVDHEGKLNRFAEKEPGAGMISAGVYLLRSELAGTLSGATPLSFEKDVFPRWLAEGRDLRVVLSEAPFLDIGTEATLPKSESFIVENLRNL